MVFNLSGSSFLILLVFLLSFKSSKVEEIRGARITSNLVDYSVKALEKPLKGKIDIKNLMPKIPKHIQVYIAVAFSERDFPSYSKIFNKTLSSIPNSFLFLDSMNRHYNVSVSPLFFVLPNSGRFSSSIYEVMCNSFERKRVVSVLVFGESPAAFTVALTSITSSIPVLWARGGNPDPPGSLQQQDPLEIRLEPNEIQLLEAVRGVFLVTHWHSFTVMAAPSLATRCASILDLPPLNPKVVPITKNPHSIFRKLADVSRSTRGVILLLCDLSEATIVMNVAKRLSMIDGHFVWLWIDTTAKPASFLTLPLTPNKNLTQKFTTFLEKTSKSRDTKDDTYYQKDGPPTGFNSSIHFTVTRPEQKFKKNYNKIAKRSTSKYENITSLKPHSARPPYPKVASNIKSIAKSETGSDHFIRANATKNFRIKQSHFPSNIQVVDAKNATFVQYNSAGQTENTKGFSYNLNEEIDGKSEMVFFEKEVKTIAEDSKRLVNDKRWEQFASMDYLSDFAISLEHTEDLKAPENVDLPVSKAWGKISEHFPLRASNRKDDDKMNLRASLLPIGLLSVKPEPMKLDRHLVKGSVRLLVSTLHSVLRKSADRLSMLDSDTSCWIKPSATSKNFSNMLAKEMRVAVKESLSGQPQFQEGDRADRSLLANFQILNLVPEKFNVNFKNEMNLIEDAVLYWRQVGKVLGRNAQLNTIVWPGGDLVASALSARTRSVFRVVTALAPPFVMEGALDEDGQCLRGVICHRVLNSDKDNLTLVFNDMETQERLEDEVEELGSDEKTEKPFKFYDQNYFEYRSSKYKYKSSCCYGLAMDLLENVAHELEFEFHLYIIPDGAYGAKNHVWEQGAPRSKWNGIVGDLVSGAAHMSFAALSVSKQRSQVIDFSTPYFFSGVSFLAAPAQKSEVPLLAFLLPFSTELWIAIFTSLNITAMAVACYEWLSPFGLNPWGRQRSRNFSIASALWVMWGLLCGHLVAFKAPKSWPNKFLINVWGGFSVIFVASYTANIAALIAGLFFHNSVSDYHDRSLLTQRIGAPKSSSAEYYIHRANQHLWEHMQKYSFKDVETGISLLRNGSLDILIADTPILDYYRATDHGCKLQKIVEAINEDTYAIGMNKGFPLKESISAVISKYSNNGYMDILTEKWYGGLPCFKMTPSVELTDVGQPRPLGVAAVAGVFLLLGLGVVVGILILILEHLFYRYTLPVLRHQPKGTIWRSRNIMFFSQKLYRFINCVELVSPHHAARELVHTLRQGQITSLFQKSVKRKEHEQRRRRKSKAQFFEMIQEIRRVQQEEKEEPKRFRNGSEDNESSPKLQLRGFLSSPRSLKHFCTSKSSVSPEISLDLTDSLNPTELVRQTRPSKSPSRLDIRRFSRELFSLPRSPKSPKMNVSDNFEICRSSSDLEDNKGKNGTKIFRGPEVGCSGKEIKIYSSKAIGRRLSKDAISWLTSSPPDLNHRRKCNLDVVQTKSLSLSENILDDTGKTAVANSSASNTAKFYDDERERLHRSLAVIGKAATFRLASSETLDTSKATKTRPRLPSPPNSPVLEFRNTQQSKISSFQADNYNIYETITTRGSVSPKKLVKYSHGRSKSLDNKHLNFGKNLIDIGFTETKAAKQEERPLNYATLQHNITTYKEHATPSQKDPTDKFIGVKNAQESVPPEAKSSVKKLSSKNTLCRKNNQGEDLCKRELLTLSPSIKKSTAIYAEPKKVAKVRKGENLGMTESVNKPKVPPKCDTLKAEQSKPYIAPKPNHKQVLTPTVYVLDQTFANQSLCEYNYYSEQKSFHKSDSCPEKRRQGCTKRCFQTFPMVREGSGISHQRHALQEPTRFIPSHIPSGRSRSMPDQCCSLTYFDCRHKEHTNQKSDFPISALKKASTSLEVPLRNPGILKNRKKTMSREEIHFTSGPPSPREKTSFRDLPQKNTCHSRNRTQAFFNFP